VFIVATDEIYVALKSKIPIMLQFGTTEELAFRTVLNAPGGMRRINAALTKIDATYAHATVATDRDLILGVVEREMGFDHFNEFIRKGIKHEYANINKAHSFR